MDIKNKIEVRDLVTEALEELNIKGISGKSDILLNKPEAIELMMGTWAVESDGGHFLKQKGGGPALGAWQIERLTFIDIIKRCNFHHAEILGMTSKFSNSISESDFNLLEKNHKLSIQIARLKYFLCPGSIPLTLVDQAKYWKHYYNTPLGGGTIDKYISKYNTYVR